MFADLPMSIGHRPVYVQRYVGLSVQIFVGLFVKEFKGLSVLRCLWVCVQMSVGLCVSICLQICLCPDVCGHVHVQMFASLSAQMFVGLSVSRILSACLCPDVHGSVCPCVCGSVSGIYCSKWPNVETVAKWWHKRNLHSTTSFTHSRFKNDTITSSDYTEMKTGCTGI